MKAIIDFEEYIKLTVELAEGRRNTQGSSKFSEIDFFLGAMVIFKYLNSMDKIPAAWVFTLMGGESILDLYLNKELNSDVSSTELFGKGV